MFGHPFDLVFLLLARILAAPLSPKLGLAEERYDHLISWVNSVIP